MIGRTLSHYRILEKLGEGGMGEVYRARDTQLDRDVAIKVLPEMEDDDGEFMFAERFQREAKSLGKLNHPNIVSVYDFGEEDGRPYLVMEYLSGENLGSLLKRKGPISLAAACGVMEPALRALLAAHEQGIVHSDFKPGNVFVTHDGPSKILDFGIAPGAQG